MLTDEQMRNGIMNPASRNQNEDVPFVSEDVFSEYCSSKLQSGLPGVEGIFHDL
jgi:hypothetical protein